MNIVSFGFRTMSLRSAGCNSPIASCPSSREDKTSFQPESGLNCIPRHREQRANQRLRSQMRDRLTTQRIVDQNKHGESILLVTLLRV